MEGGAKHLTILDQTGIFASKDDLIQIVVLSGHPKQNITPKLRENGVL